MLVFVPVYVFIYLSVYVLVYKLAAYVYYSTYLNPYGCGRKSLRFNRRANWQFFSPALYCSILGVKVKM